MAAGMSQTKGRRVTLARKGSQVCHPSADPDTSLQGCSCGRPCRPGRSSGSSCPRARCAARTTRACWRPSRSSSSTSSWPAASARSRYVSAPPWAPGLSAGHASEDLRAVNLQFTPTRFASRPTEAQNEQVIGHSQLCSGTGGIQTHLLTAILFFFLY